MAALLLSAVLAPAQAAPSSISFKFTSFDYPGAVATQGLGINNADVIVGYFLDSSLVSHGFARLPNGTFLEIDDPDGIRTLLFGINDSNLAVGFYADSNDLDQGFQFRYPNQFTAINYPGASMTTPYGINNAGQVVGAWGVEPTQGGFSLSNGNYTNLVYPNAQLTYPSGVNSSGIIAGSWVNTCNPQCQYHGFMLTGVSGTYSDVDFPGAVMTHIYGVNDLNQVVGSYDNQTGPTHCWAGFPARNQFITVDYPGSNGCVVGGITKKGHLAGWYADSSNVVHGFLAVPK